MLAGCTHLLVTAVPSTLRINTPSAWSKPQHDAVHRQGRTPMTRYFQETHAPSFRTGTNDFARFYGMLIDGLQIGYVGGFGYNQVLPAPEAEIPQRFDRAEE